MTISEKVAYLKGLYEGMDLKADSKDAKLFNVIIDILEDVALGIEDLEENALNIAEEIDELSDDLAAVEELFDDDGDDDECDCGHDHGGHSHGHGDDECDCGCCDGEEMPVFYEVTCPACGNEITIDEDVLILGSIACPNCNENLEFDMDSISSEDEEETEDED